MKTQRELKPKIEDVLHYYIDGNELQTALEFISHLRAHKINLRWAGVHNFWNAKNKGKNICYVKLGGSWIGRKLPGTEIEINWEVILNLINMSEYENEIIYENMQNYIWDGLAHCRACNNGCSPGVNKTILGKNFTGLCNGMFYTRFVISFANPDEAAINCIKRLLGLEQKAREEAIKNKN